MPNASKPRIMHLIATNFYGGPEKQITEHLKRLDNSRFQGCVASFIEKSSNALLEKAGAEGIEHYGIRMPGPFSLSALKALVNLMKEKQVRLLCAHGYKSTIMGLLASRSLGTHVITFSRGYTAEDRKVAFYEWLERKTLNKLDGIIFVSEGQREKLKRMGIIGKRAWVVHNSVAAGRPVGDNSSIKSRVLRSLSIPDGSTVVVTAGRLSREKGHEYLLDAIALLRHLPNTVFVFCGEGKLRGELEKKAARNLRPDSYRFAGFRRDMQDVFDTMDLFVLPSLTEGLPNVVLEAFSCGKPVVATAVGGVPELVRDGVNGILVPPGRADLLSDAMSRCLASKELMSRLGDAGRRTVLEDFSFEGQARKLEEIYAEVLNNAKT